MNPPCTPFSTSLTGSGGLLARRVRAAAGFAAGRSAPARVPLLVLALAVCLLSGDLASCGAPAGAVTADLDRDGVPEQIDVAYLEDQLLYELTVTEAGQVLYRAEAATAHAGWNSLFLCRRDGADYLLQYNPYMAQGWGDYRYALFHLDGAGGTVPDGEGAVEFDINFYGPTDIDFDVDAIAGFLEEVNGLLSDSTLLLSTDQEVFEHDGGLFHIPYFLLSDSSVYSYDPGLSLRENLAAYRQGMEESWEEIDFLPG